MSEPTLYNTLKDIADAIRAKGVTGTMSALEMPTKIEAIQTEKYGIPIDGFVGDVDENGNLLRTAAGGDTFSFRSSDIVSIPTGYFQSAFRGRNVLDITLPNMTTIGTYTFEWVAALSPTLSSVSMPELSDIPDFGLQYAFRGCSALQSVDLDAAQTVGESGLQGCCYNDTALVTFNAPSISSVGQGGMYRCFSGCTSLEEVSLSSLTSAGNQGLDECFMGCTSLKKVQMPLSNAGTNALRNTFNGCSALEEVDFSEATSVPTLSNINCFANTNETYRIIVPDSLYSQWIAASGWSEQGVVEHIMGATEAETLTFTAAQAGSTIAMNAVGAAPSISLEYSTDNGTTWNDFTVGSTTITLSNVGDKANIRAKTPNTQLATGENDRNTFSFTGEVVVSGNVASMLNKDLEQGKVLDSTTTRHLCGLFYGCSNLVGSAKQLVIPFETLYADSISSMFRGTGITSAPELLCTNSNGSAYTYMFENCANLVNPPSVLPITDLKNYDYYFMFKNCTSLTSTPQMMVEKANGTSCCSEMFNGCSSLTSVDLSSLQQMGGYGVLRSAFQNCTSLTEVDLSSLVSVTGQSGLESAFQGCSSLVEVELPSLTTLNSRQCALKAFSGCTSLKKVSMPVLHVVNNYRPMYAMFDNCSALEDVVMGQLTSVGSTDEWSYLFSHCTSLKLVDFSGTTRSVPRLNNVNAFNDTNSTFKIVVPDALYDQWKAANNWSQFASQIVKASEYVPAA